MSIKNLIINLTVNSAEASMLNKLAKKQKKSVSGLVYELVMEALDKREDFALSAIAESRDTQKAKRVSHEEIYSCY